LCRLTNDKIEAWLRKLRNKVAARPPEMTMGDLREYILGIQEDLDGSTDPDALLSQAKAFFPAYLTVTSPDQRRELLSVADEVLSKVIADVLSESA